jgi:dihydrolipoamide dehydrogenase
MQLQCGGGNELNGEMVYDLVVLGGGPGGYTAAFRGADLGLKVCLIERQNCLGGVCLNVGCIPSKTLLHGAAIMEEAREIREFGISFERPSIDLDIMRAKKKSVINRLTQGLDGLAKARNITRLQGNGKFLNREQIRVDHDDSHSIVRFKNSVIATGSRPIKLPGMPKDSRIWDSTRALELGKIPERLLVIGGGIIGLEMAQVYSALGTQITIVEMLDHIIPPADKDMVQPLFQKLKKRYTLLTRAKVNEIRALENVLQVSIENSKGEEEIGEYDNILVAVGRQPNSGGIGLTNLDIDITERGFIEVDSQQRATTANIFAVGDVVGDPMLAHKATHQGKVVAEVIAGHDVSFSSVTIPSVAYTHPEVAWMGLTEREIKEKNIGYEKGKFAWGASGRALTAGVSHGASKVLFAKETGQILGAAICGLNAGELIHEAVLALKMGATAADISKTIHAHPTLAETFAFACEMVDGSITDGLPQKRK